MDKTRLEAFSDGVFAIAITLLALNLQVPSRSGHGLPRALGHQWPAYAAYVVSFMVIGIIWMNHHSMLRSVRLVDRRVLVVNLLLLLTVGLIPFATALLAAYLRAGFDGRVAAAVYSGVMFAMAVSFSLLWLAVLHDGAHLHKDVDPAAARLTLRRFGMGQGAYLATIGLAFLNAPLTLTVHFAIACYYIFEQLPVPSSG